MKLVVKEIWKQRGKTKNEKTAEKIKTKKEQNDVSYEGKNIKSLKRVIKAKKEGN